MDSYNTPVSAQPNDFPSLHPVLRPMRRTASRMIDAGDVDRAFSVLHALARLNGKPSFLRGSAHLHYNEEGQVRHE